MISPLFLQYIHFSNYLFAGLTFLAIAWLYYDAYRGSKEKWELYLLYGYLLLALSFLAEATFVDESFSNNPLFPQAVLNIFIALTRLPGFILIMVSLYYKPLTLEPHPEGHESTIQETKTGTKVEYQTLAINEEKTEAAIKKSKKSSKTKKTKKQAAVASIPIVTPIIKSIFLIIPFLSIATALGYRRRVKIGLEKQLSKAVIAFYILSGSFILSLARLLRDTDNVTLFNLVAAYGPLWIIEQIILIAASVMFVMWFWQYLLRRFESQLFMIFIATAVVLFLITTFSFSALLLNDIEGERIESLQTDVQVLNFVIENSKTTHLFDAESIGGNTIVRDLIENRDHDELATLASELLLAKDFTQVVFVDNKGQVLARGTEPDRFGDSLSDNIVLSQALTGESVKSIATEEGALAPIIFIEAAAPIIKNNQIIGAVGVGSQIGNSTLDFVKQETGLDVAVYAGDILSATTVTTGRDANRNVGQKLPVPEIAEAVLERGETAGTKARGIDIEFLTAYKPLKDANGNNIGILFIGEPAAVLSDTLARTVELTFIVSAILILLSAIPAYYVARYIAYQVS